VGIVLEIARVAGVSVWSPFGSELIRAKDMGDFLATAAALHATILGVEGFTVDGDSLTPDMDAIADFSDLTPGEERGSRSVAEARRFVAEISKPGMWFEVTVSE